MHVLELKYMYALYTCIIVLLHACFTALVQARTFGMVKAYSPNIVHACLFGAAHACIMVVVCCTSHLLCSGGQTSWLSPQPVME